MRYRLSRRAFLRLSALSLAGMAFTPVWPRYADYPSGELARIAIKEIDLRARPNDTSAIIGKRYRDQIVHVYEKVISPDGPAYNPLWYRVWGGYLHSAHIQEVQVRLNQPAKKVVEVGQLGEISVPFSPAYLKNRDGTWSVKEGYTLYYETTHWVTGVEEGPDGEPWYQLTSEIDSAIYFIPARHLRLIPSEEIAPISTHIPPEKKRIEILIKTQELKAYEYDELVFQTRISSGIPSRGQTSNGIPTDTPKGTWRVNSKMPSKHMGSVSGNPDVEERGGFRLPGVPWTCFFHETGVALHGTYWHNNFGVQMSHGCVNLRNTDAKWLFRWTTPVYPIEIKSHTDWEKTGYGTLIEVRDR
jgi:hypothetical protein